MKKIILAATLILISTCVGMAQTEKALKMGKWYANAELGSKTIALTKTISGKSEFDMELVSDVAMNYGQTAKADFINNEGGQTKAGTYYVSGYAYKISGNTIVITSQPSIWTYNVKTLQNGDVLLEIVTPTNKNTK